MSATLSKMAELIRETSPSEALVVFQDFVQSLPVSVILLIVAAFSAVIFHIFYSLYWHPLAKFPGPWYCSLSSLPLAIISLRKTEPQFLLSLVRKYGTDKPIRISPSLLLFPRPSALREIYWDAKLNQRKTSLYGTGILGPPHLFTTLDGDVHRALRKALGGPYWAIGSLKNEWEPRIDDQVQLFVEKMNEHASAKDKICLSDKVAEFAADIMTMISFTNPWGFVQNGRDERDILKNWREGLDLFGVAGRWKFLQKYILTLPGIGSLILPKTTDNGGMGWLVNQATKQVQTREELNATKGYKGKPDFMQHALNARIDGEPLSQVQKVSHVTLLIQAGADTTGTGLGSTLRFLALHDDKRKKLLAEMEAAERAGKLSTPVQFEEVREYLPYMCACIKEGLRLNPPATNLFGRVTPDEGIKIDGHFIPGGMDITSHAYVVQRDPELYAPDPEAFRPERWLENDDLAREMDASSFVFGMGPRVCLGKDIAIMELHKLLPETLRRFNINVVKAGRYVVAGGVAYNREFIVQLTRRG